MIASVYDLLLLTCSFKWLIIASLGKKKGINHYKSYIYLLYLRLKGLPYVITYRVMIIWWKLKRNLGGLGEGGKSFKDRNEHDRGHAAWHIGIYIYIYAWWKPLLLELQIDIYRKIYLCIWVVNVCYNMNQYSWKIIMK
jgi:hypothetical protein